MSAVSIIFFLVFFFPLAGLLIWVMRQDKRKGKIGLFVLGGIITIGLFYLYFMTKGK